MSGYLLRSHANNPGTPAYVHACVLCLCANTRIVRVYMQAHNTAFTHPCQSLNQARKLTWAHVLKQAIDQIAFYQDRGGGRGN